MTDPLLSQAWALYRKGRFAEVNGLLEPQILKYRSDPEFYRILGVSCLRLGDWSGGETYLSRSLQLDPEQRLQVELALIAVSMKKRDFSEAVRLSLSVLDHTPRCRPAKRALATLRKALASSPVPGPLQAQDWQALLPKVSRWRGVSLPPSVLRGLVTATLIFSAIVGIWWGAQVTQFALPGLPANPVADTRPGANLLTAPEGSPEVVATLVTPSRLSLSTDEIRQALSQVQKLFQEYRDSECRREINRILLSNAAPATKERVRGLLTYLHAPDFARPEPSADYQDVRGFPELYEGCTIRWKGVISNLVSGTNEITFDLLLGYQDGQVVEGVIPVRLGFASLLKNSQVVDLLGQVALSGGKWFVEGRGILPIGYRAP